MAKDSKIKIIVDSREQAPLLFENYPDVVCYKDTLACGDYTLCSCDRPNDDESIMIERKKDSLELIGNLGRHYDRFVAELTQMSAYRHKQIIVCGPPNFEYLYESGLVKLHPNFAYKQLAEILCRFNIPTLFMCNRDQVENYIYRLFKRCKYVST